MKNKNNSSIVLVAPWIPEFIKKHAKSSVKEIYGWLIGGETKKNGLIVYSAISCHRYLHQTSIGAIPDTKEMQDISAALPQGLGVIGIYHSHPGDIFHSHTDDQTLENFTRFYPKMLSAVTNRDVFEDERKNRTRWYQFSPKLGKTREIHIKTHKISNHDRNTTQILGILKMDLLCPCRPNVNQYIIQSILQNYSSIWNQARISFSKRNSPHTGYAFNKESDLSHSPKNSNENSLLLTEMDYPKFFHELKHTQTPVISLQYTSTSVETRADQIKSSDPIFNIRIHGQMGIILNLHDFSSRIRQLASWTAISDYLASEFRDEIMRKIARSVLAPGTNPSQMSILFEQPMSIPYPGVSLKIDQFLLDFPALIDSHRKYQEQALSNIPEFEKYLLSHISNISDSALGILRSWEKRAITLFLTGMKTESHALLKLLLDIYTHQKRIEAIERISNQLAILNQK